MSTNDLETQESFGNHTIDARDVRALTSVMSVLDDVPDVAGADDLYAVISGSGKQYIVDLREGACTCPDFEHNLPVERDDGTTRHTCKHIARVTYETGARPIPGWVSIDALDDQIGIHIDDSPVVARAAVTDGGRVATVESDDDTDVEDVCEDCQELGALEDDSVLSCFACFSNAGERQ